MPLSDPAPRALNHTRSLEITGYQRDDGLWDIEGHLVDVKPFEHGMGEDSRAANQAIHDMWLRITIDDDYLVHGAEAWMDVGAYRICNQVSPNFAALKGLSIGPGWNKRVRERLGGAHGCTHLIEMLAQMATTAMQTLWSAEEEKDRAAGREMALPDGMLDSCYAYRREGPLVAERYPGQATPAEREASD